MKTIADQRNCASCTEPVDQGSRFCPHCGHYLKHSHESGAFNSSLIQVVFIYYFIELFLCLLVQTNLIEITFSSYLVIDIISAIVTLVFASFTYKELLPLFSWSRIRPLLLLLFIPLAIFAAILVNILTDRLNTSLFHEEYYYYYFYEDLSHPVLAMVLTIAISPAIFEELAFRGFLYNYLKKLFDEKLVIIVTAFIFALLHLSFISFIWLFGFGWVLAYLRKKYHTLWYGIVIHFFFNLTAIVYELWKLRLLKF